MDKARCTLDNVCYFAENFAKLPPDEIAKKRHRLICEGCKSTAYYRKSYTIGGGKLVAACFGALDHKEGCSTTASGTERTDTDDWFDEHDLINHGQRIVLDLNFGDQTTNGNSDRDDLPRGRQGGHRRGGGGSSESNMPRRLSTLLTHLRTSQTFRTSQKIIIEVDGKGEFTIAEFFVEFDAVMPSHDYQYGGYWGKISNLRKSGDVLWLNTDWEGGVSIQIRSHLIDAFYERFRKPHENGLNISYALVLGTLQVGHAGKRYVQPDDLAYVFVQ